MQLMKVCQALADLGHEVCLWVPESKSPAGWPELAEHYGIRGGFRIQPRPGRAAFRRLDFCIRAALEARNWRADLAYVWPYQAAALCAWLGLPTLMEIHDRPPRLAGRAWFWLFLRGRGARRLLVTTGALRTALRADYGVRIREPFAVLAPNGVDLDAYAGLPEPQAARQELHLPERFTAGYTGHLYAGRGIPLMARLAAQNPRTEFLWVGGEPDQVQAWAARL